MSFTVTDFKSNMAAQSGGARPSLYQVDINGKSTITRFSNEDNLLVKATSFPAANIAPLSVNYAGRAYKWNGFRTYDNWTVTVINDETFEARNQMMQWMRLISGQFDGERNNIFGNQLVGEKTWFDGDATVKQLSTSGKVLQTYKFNAIWPTEIAAIPVDWSSDALMEYTITFCYDWWDHAESIGSPL